MVNKISFIFAHRDTDIWSTPLSIVREFQAREWQTEIITLFDRKDNYTDKNIIDFIEQTQHEDHPDIVMHMDWGRFDSPWLGKKYMPGVYWVMESGDDPQNFDRNSVKAHKFDLVLTPDFSSYQQYREGGHDVLWWTHFADTKIHRPVKRKENQFPVRSTRGEGGSQFLDFMNQIMSDKFLNKNGLMGGEYGYFLSQAKIVLQNSRWKEVTRRIFEGMACGAMVLTDRLPENTHIDDIFTEGDDIVYYDGVYDCISKINYYLWNEEERQWIADQGRMNVLRNHTQVQRVDSILKKYKEWNENFR